MSAAARSSALTRSQLLEICWRSQAISLACPGVAAASQHSCRRSLPPPVWPLFTPLPVCCHSACRGQLSAGQRRVAFDSLGMYQQLQAAGHDPRGPEAWAAARRYAAAVSAILAADGVRCEAGASIGVCCHRWRSCFVQLVPVAVHAAQLPACNASRQLLSCGSTCPRAAAGAPRPLLRSWSRCRSGRCGT